MSGKKILEEVITVIDENGVIKNHNKTRVFYLPKEPPYVKLYIDDLSRLLGVPKAGNYILYALVKRMNFEGLLVITKPMRVRIADEIGIKPQAVANNITLLVKSGLLKRLDFCEYELNPNLFAKGDWQDIMNRRKNFELKISYEENGTRSITGKAQF